MSRTSAIGRTITRAGELRRRALLLLLCGLASSVALDAAVAGPPRELLFTEDFELERYGLEDARLHVPELSLFLPHWHQTIAGVELPRFMGGALARVSQEVDGARLGRRYLRFPMLGGDARMTGPPLPASVKARERLSFGLDATWSRLGSGAIHFGLRTSATGAPIQLLTITAKSAGSESSAGWRHYDFEARVPESFEHLKLEIWIDGDPTVQDGEFGFDNVTIARETTLDVSWQHPFRVVRERDIAPVRVRVMSCDRGAYRIDLSVLAGASREPLLKRPLERWVQTENVLEFEPRLEWKRHGLARGRYTLLVQLTSVEQGWQLESAQDFVFAGELPFPPGESESGFGVEIPLTTDAPAWLELAAGGEVSRLLVRLAPNAVADAKLPDWLARYGAWRRNASIDVRTTWDATAVSALQPLFTAFRSWYLAPGAPAIEAELRAAGYLRLSAIETSAELRSRGRSAQPASAPLIEVDAMATALWKELEELGRLDLPAGWSALVSARSLIGDEPAAEHSADRLARTLLLLATIRPETVYLRDPAALLLSEAADGDPVADRAFLAWEHTISFLSGARFRGFEPWDARGVCAIFEREGEQLLVLVSDEEPHNISLNAERAIVVYDAIGAARTIEPDSTGRVELVVSASPWIVRGLDLARARTVKSLRAKSGPLAAKAGDTQAIAIEVRNHHALATTLRLALTTPVEWQMASALESRRVEPGATAEWNLTFKTPSWFGIDEAIVLRGELRSEFADGSSYLEEVELALPVESSYLEIRAVSITRGEAEVLVRNRSDEPLTLALLLEVRPSGAERLFPEEELAAGQDRIYRMTYDLAEPPPAGWQLFAGATLLRKQTYVNKLFAIP
ncbi:MAG: hypothetical protein ACKVX7_11420 [Planctomycetota bacterium]